MDGCLQATHPCMTALLAAVSGNISLRSQMLIWFDLISLWVLHASAAYFEQKLLFRNPEWTSWPFRACCLIMAGVLSKVCTGCDLRLPILFPVSDWGIILSRKSSSLCLNSKVLSYISFALISSYVALGNLHNCSEPSYIYTWSLIFLSFRAFSDQIFQSCDYRKEP